RSRPAWPCSSTSAAAPAPAAADPAWPAASPGLSAPGRARPRQRLLVAAARMTPPASRPRALSLSLFDCRHTPRWWRAGDRRSKADESCVPPGVSANPFADLARLGQLLPANLNGHEVVADGRGCAHLAAAPTTAAAARGRTSGRRHSGGDLHVPFDAIQS